MREAYTTFCISKLPPYSASGQYWSLFGILLKQGAMSPKYIHTPNTWSWLPYLLTLSPNARGLGTLTYAMKNCPITWLWLFQTSINLEVKGLGSASASSFYMYNRNIKVNWIPMEKRGLAKCQMCQLLKQGKDGMAVFMISTQGWYAMKVTVDPFPYCVLGISIIDCTKHVCVFCVCLYSW